MTLVVAPPRWELQSFERRLAVLELARLAGQTPRATAGGLSVAATSAKSALLDRLAFAATVSVGSDVLPTKQARLEQLSGSDSRKSTTHALHGLHPYKGKFYPQLARALINVCASEADSVVLDPFAGCGTTTLEAALVGVQAIGIDTNPLAVLVARTKLRLLRYPVGRLNDQVSMLFRVRAASRRLSDNYLRAWLPAENGAYLASLLAAIDRLDSRVAADAARVVLSSVLRSASYQEPSQLRVYRRKSGNIPELRELFVVALHALIADLTVFQNADVMPPRSSSRVMEGDARSLSSIVRRLGVHSVDAIVTSPPYASALPYIDTDRLSIRALGLFRGASQRSLEQRQIGNREISDAECRALHAELRNDNLDWAPPPLRTALRASLSVAAESESGFRRKRTPGLLFRYFRDMKTVLHESRVVLKRRGRAAFVIGDNGVAGPNGSMLSVPTARILTELARDEGLHLVGDLTKSLTSYSARETVHHRNAMRAERVLIFEKP